MLVLVLEDLEDTNKFARDEEGFERALSEGYAQTKHIPEVTYLDDAKTEPLIVRRIDILKANQVYDLPEKQAKNLVELGLARNA